MTMPDCQQDPPEVQIRPQEQLLIEALQEFAPGRILCTSQGVAQLAAAAARRFPLASVYCHYFDLFPAEKARLHAGNNLPNVVLGCSSDFPALPFDLAALPLSAQG